MIFLTHIIVEIITRINLDIMKPNLPQNQHWCISWYN